MYKIQCTFESQQIEFCNYAIDSNTISLRYSVITPSGFSALVYVMSTASTVVIKRTFDGVHVSKDGVSPFLSSVTERALICIEELEWDNG